MNVNNDDDDDYDDNDDNDNNDYDNNDDVCPPEMTRATIVLACVPDS